MSVDDGGDFTHRAEFACGALAGRVAELRGQSCGCHVRNPSGSNIVRNVGSRSFAGPAAQSTALGPQYLGFGLRSSVFPLPASGICSNKDETRWSACVNRMAFAGSSPTLNTQSCGNCRSGGIVIEFV